MQYTMHCYELASLWDSPITMSSIFLLRIPGAFFTLH